MPIQQMSSDTYVSELFKLGYKDSNLEMLESESSALPFGDSPLPQQMVVYTKAQNNASTFLKKFKKIFRLAIAL